MDNIILDEIKDIAIEKLKNAYGFCGCISGSAIVMLNSNDRAGKDIKITFETEEE